ncbi:MAG: TVP38/TMEM64 family protein [Chloroflexota bacterium]
MRHYLLAVVAVIAFFLALFLIGEALGIPFLEDPLPWLQQAGWYSAVIGVALLAVDVVLPVPSNIVMIAHGALFGVLVGTALSLLGSMLAAVASFWIGRRGGRLLSLAVPADERAHADAILTRWGLVAILVSRPLPLLAETILVLAGASVMTWRTAMLATFLGSIPPSLFYAWAGAASIGFEGGALVFGGVILLAALTGLTLRQLERSRLKPVEEGTSAAG